MDISVVNKLYRAELPGRELLECEINSKGEVSFKAVASKDTLKILRSLKNQAVQDWSMPQGNSSSEILVRELIQKVRGTWFFPIEDPELCHCRKVSATKIDQAIVSGAHTIEKIRRITSANTACGGCQDDIEKLLKFRLSC